MSTDSLPSVPVQSPTRGAASRLGRLPELAIESVIRLCGWSAILFVFGIFFFVFREGAPLLFGGLNLGEFFTSSDWNPVSETPHYGILGLLAGTVSVTVLAMAIAVPLGLGAAVYRLRVLARRRSRRC